MLEVTINTWQYCAGSNKYILLVIAIYIPIAISIFLGLVGSELMNERTIERGFLIIQISTVQFYYIYFRYLIIIIIMS